MNIGRIKGIFFQEFFITRRSLEIIMDVIFFPIVSMIVFGFISTYLVGKTGSIVANYALLGILLWNLIHEVQYSVAVGALWNVWSRNLSNMFISPLTLGEYLVGHIFMGITKALLLLVLESVLAIIFFKFNILAIGLTNLVIYFLNLTIFGWSIGIFALGLIFRYGTRIQAIAWNIVFLFQPLTAAFFPVSVLPPVLQSLAYAFPSTYIFEAARANLNDVSTQWSMITPAILINIVYFVLSLGFFKVMFERSKRIGQFARNEQ